MFDLVLGLGVMTDVVLGLGCMLELVLGRRLMTDLNDGWAARIVVYLDTLRVE